MVRYSFRLWSAQVFLLHLVLNPLATLAYDPSKRRCVGDNVCLTSFYWCFQYDRKRDDQPGCSFPDGAYPMTLKDEYHNKALLISTTDYVISWKKGDPTNENPVTIGWYFTHDFFDPLYNPGPKWETNITGNSSSFTFNPEKVLSEFPTELAPNVTSEMARWDIGQDGGSRIAVSMRRRGVSSNSSDDEAFSEDWSQSFIVVSPRFERFLTAQKVTGQNEMYDKWKLGVGVGVGLAVPLLMLASAVLGWLVGKKRATRGPQAMIPPSK